MGEPKSNTKTEDRSKFNIKLIYMAVVPSAGVVGLIIITLVACLVLHIKRNKAKNSPANLTEDHYRGSVVADENENELHHLYMTPNIAYHSRVTRLFNRITTTRSREQEENGREKTGIQTRSPNDNLHAEEEYDYINSTDELIQRLTTNTSVMTSHENTENTYY